MRIENRGSRIEDRESRIENRGSRIEEMKHPLPLGRGAGGGGIRNSANMEESLESLLLLESSRRNTDMVADLVLKKTDLFSELVSILLKNKHPVSWKAAWAMDVVSEKQPDLLRHHLNRIIDHLELFTDDGAKREVLRMLSRSSMPENK